MSRQDANWYKDEEAVRVKYNEVAKDYGEHWGEQSPIGHLFKMRRHRVMEMLPDTPPCELLDVGCGPAMIACDLVEKGFNYHGVDLSEGMIGEARKTYADNPRADFRVARAQRLPFSDESMDVVTCLGMLEYVTGIDVIFEEIARVLNLRGIFIFSMQNRRSPYRIAERVFDNWTEPCIQFSESFANKLLKSHGFRRIDCVYYDFNLLPRPLDIRHPRVSIGLSERSEFLCRSPLKWLGTYFLIKAQRLPESG